MFGRSGRAGLSAVESRTWFRCLGSAPALLATIRSDRVPFARRRLGGGRRWWWWFGRGRRGHRSAGWDRLGRDACTHRGWIVAWCGSGSRRWSCRGGSRGGSRRANANPLTGDVFFEMVVLHNGGS